MSVTLPPDSQDAIPPVQTVPAEVCPLCGAGLHSAQEWCLRCGAAARTRLAATPRWRGPVIVLATIVVISLGVLIASAVKLVG